MGAHAPARMCVQTKLYRKQDSNDWFVSAVLLRRLSRNLRVCVCVCVCVHCLQVVTVLATGAAFGEWLAVARVLDDQSSPPER